MNYNYLRYFSVLAQVQHYTIAAARLEISQPALSSAIRNLENELGVKLFEKAGRNIRLTQEGEFYRRQVDDALRTLHDANETLISGRDVAPEVLRIGFVSGIWQKNAGRLVANFLQKNPRCRFHLTEGSARDLMDLLRQEKLDMAIVDTVARDRNLQFRKLWEKELWVALEQDHPLADRTILTHAELAQYPQIGFDHSLDRGLEDWEDTHATEGQTVCQINTVVGALRLVSAGVGLAVIPGDCTIPIQNVIYVPLENRHQALYLCVMHDRWLDDPVRNFAEQLRKVQSPL